jgi:mono/diheme cytochrome c family protein
MGRSSPFLAVASLVLAAAVTPWLAVSPAQAAPARTIIITPMPTPAPTPERLPDAAAGLLIYQEHCAACHGPLGRGGGEMADRLPSQPPSFADPATMREVRPDEAYDIVTNGRIDKLMPPWKDALSAQERWDAIYGAWSFYYSPARLVRGREAWEAHCASCHTGGVLPLFPEQMVVESQSDLFARARNPRFAAHAAVAEVPDAELWAALDYARTLTFDALPFEDLSLGGVVGGRVSNGSQGSGTAAGARIAAVPFDEATGSILPDDPVSATVGAAGVYTLTGLLAGPGLSYRIVASYGGADYIQPDDIVLAGGDAAPSRADFEVFEPSTDVPLSVRRVEIALSPRPEAGLLDVAEAWVIVNGTDRTKVAGAGGMSDSADAADAGLAAASFRIDLLPGAFDIEIDDPRVRASAAMTGTVLSTRAAMPPGEHPVMLRYSVPYDAETFEIDRGLELPAQALRISVMSEGAVIQSETLGAPETAQASGQAITRASASDLAEGSRIMARIEGLPAPEVEAQVPGVMRPLAPPLFGRTALAGTALALAFAGLLLVFAYPVLAARRDPRRQAARLAAERSRVIAAIAELDRRYAKGEVAAAPYAARRAALVDRAIMLARAGGPDEEEPHA